MEPNNFPNITLTSAQLPEIADMEIGKSYEFMITVELKGQRKAERYDMPMKDSVEGQTDQNNVLIADFAITEVESCGEEDKETKDMEDFEMQYADRRSPTYKIVKVTP